MSRKRINREMAEQRYQDLWQFLGCYLHQDWPVFHGSPEGAVDDAIRESSRERCQAALTQLDQVVAAAEDDVDLRRILNDCFGVNVWFRKPREARDFARMIQDKLLASTDRVQ
jgi:hypothetical protein